jgi:hypothetical protein
MPLGYDSDPSRPEGWDRVAIDPTPMRSDGRWRIAQTQFSLLSYVHATQDFPDPQGGRAEDVENGGEDKQQGREEDLAFCVFVQDSRGGQRVGDGLAAVDRQEGPGPSARVSLRQLPRPATPGPTGPRRAGPIDRPVCPRPTLATLPPINLGSPADWVNSPWSEKYATDGSRRGRGQRRRSRGR